jgi:hypothetical protein
MTVHHTIDVDILPGGGGGHCDIHAGISQTENFKLIVYFVDRVRERVVSITNLLVLPRLNLHLINSSLQNAGVAIMF